MQDVVSIREKFKDKLEKSIFTIDKSGVKTVELIGESFIANNDTIFGTLNTEYAEKELDWYLSQSLNVYDMPNPPKIWRDVSDKDGYIHSNYGYLIFSKENHNQFVNVIRELRKNKDTRRACMIYTRPSIHEEYNKNGMSDFICTNNTQIFIRDNKLHYLVNQRSCDAVFGYKNDRYWHNFVMERVYDNLQEDYPDLELGDLIFQVGSLHVYERHFKFINS